MSTAGDVNGDGHSDVIFGARLYDDGESDEGGAFVCHGSASSPPVPALTRWGLIAMAGVLASMALWRLRRRPADGRGLR